MTFYYLSPAVSCSLSFDQNGKGLFRKMKKTLFSLTASRNKQEQIHLSSLNYFHFNAMSSLPLECLTRPTQLSCHMHTQHFNIPFSRTDVNKYSFYIPARVAR